MAVRRRTSRPAPPPAPVGRALPPLLRRAWYGLNQAFRRRIAHLDLTPDQYTALRNLDEAGDAGLTQSELTSRMSSDPNTIASLVERMEEGGLLGRETDPDDRRARRLRLAPAGHRRFVAARDLARDLQEEVFAGFPAEEREPFLAALEQLGEACRLAAETDASTPAAGPRARRAGRPARS